MESSNTFRDSAVLFFHREFDRLTEEINAYTDESLIWKLAGDINNSPGQLTLHLVGTMNHFIGGVMGQNGYERDRDGEFEAQVVSRETLLMEIEKVKGVIAEVIPVMTDEQIVGPFPISFRCNTPTVTYMFMQFLWHLGYHIGQINYHRRLISAP